MKGVISEVPRCLLDWRRRTGADRWDEMWEGVIHMPPMPNRDHQNLVKDLLIWLEIHWARPRGNRAGDAGRGPDDLLDAARPSRVYPRPFVREAHGGPAPGNPAARVGAFPAVRSAETSLGKVVGPDALVQPPPMSTGRANHANRRRSRKLRWLRRLVNLANIVTLSWRFVPSCGKTWEASRTDIGRNDHSR
jgi:hypothetical protein